VSPCTKGYVRDSDRDRLGRSQEDGIAPYAGLVMDTAGNLYGTASAGGATGHGTVFEITP